jgi:hypothetical protein
MTQSISSLTALASILSDSSTQATASTPIPSWSDVRGGVLSAVSGELGISQSDLTTQLKSGKSMSQIATAAGISSSDLTATIQGALAQSGLPSGVNLATMATRMANNVNNASIDDDPPAAAASTTTSTTSSGLGIDTSTLSDVNMGGVSLDSSEISMLLGSSGSSLDTYL